MTAALLGPRLVAEMQTAMKSGDRERVSVIRLLMAEAKNREIEKGRDQSLNEDEMIEVVMTAIKQRRESIEQFTKGGREELAGKERRELAILQGFLPPPLSRGELEGLVRQAIQETGAAEVKDMGRVMKAVMPSVAGRAEGAEVSRIVRELLIGR